MRVSRDGKPISTVAGGEFALTLEKSSTYRVEANGAPPPVTFAAADGPTLKQLDRAVIGLGPSCCAPPESYDPHQDITGYRDAGQVR